MIMMEEEEEGTLIVEEDPEGDLSLSLLRRTALTLPSFPEGSLTSVISAMPSKGSPVDCQLLSLAESLSNPLRAMVKANLVSAWDVADILDSADSLLHRNWASRDPNDAILSIGIGFVQRIEQILSFYSRSGQEKRDSACSLKVHDKTQEDDSLVLSQHPSLERGIQDLKDYFHILNKLYDQEEVELALDFIAFFKKGWWARSKTMDQILEDCRKSRTLKKEIIPRISPTSSVTSSSSLKMFFQRHSSQSI